MKKYAALIVIGVCLTGTVFFIVGAEKSSGNAVFQDSYNGLEEVFSDSPERIENESIGKEENDSVEETEPYVRIWTAEELIEMERSNIQSQSARQYEIQQYEYEGEIPQDIRNCLTKRAQWTGQTHMPVCAQWKNSAAGRIIPFWQ